MIRLRSIVVLLAGLGLAALAAAQEATPPSSHVRVATVVEMQIAGNYVYLRLDEGGEETWLATTPSLAKGINYGNDVEFIAEVEMQDFHSRALNRTFESIWFVSRIRAKPAPTPADQK